MEPLAILLLVLLLLTVLIIFPIWAFVTIRRSRSELDYLRLRVDDLESTLRARPTPPPSAPASVSASQPSTLTSQLPSTPSVSQLSALDSRLPSPPPLPPVLPRPTPPLPSASVSASQLSTLSSRLPIPPPPSASVSVSDSASGSQLTTLSSRLPIPKPRPPINWEQFMGVKLFAWLGGLAAFLAVAYFIKYSFDHDLIPKEVRAAFGFLFSAGLLAGGLLLSRKRYTVTAQTLCATGIVSLYAVTFGCHAVYHFSFFDVLPTFGLMALITATAFLLAVRMDAKVVAILGLLGGFLTPRLLSTGVDNPPGLFGYIALLDLGLLAVALHRRWHFLVPLGALCTAIIQTGWAAQFLTHDKSLTAMTVCLAFEALFLAAVIIARRLGQTSRALSLPVVGLAAVAFIFATYFALGTPTGLQPAKLFTFLFLVDLGVLALSALDENSARLHFASGLATFALLGAWTAARLNPVLLPFALGAYFVFAVLHAAFPLVLARYRPASSPGWLGQLFPPLALLLVLGPVLNSPVVSFLVWPAILLLDLLAIALAALTGLLAAVYAALLLTLLAAAVWLFKIPADLGAMPPLLLVIGGFSILFFGAGLWLARKFIPATTSGSSSAPSTASQSALNTQLPVMSALLPFILLVMAVARLPVPDPTAIFGLTLLLVVLTLGLSRWLVLEWLPACALGGTLAVLSTWYGRHFQIHTALTPLAWILGFHAIFATFPFLFRRTFSDTRGPWIASAASGVVLFPLVFGIVKLTWPNDFMGLLPAAFVLPPLAGLLAILRLDPVDHPRRLGRLALFGGVALLFITLVFPIQFDRHWITLGWALEGAALLWLFHRVPHRGLPIAGVILLIAASARLTLNPAVLSYQIRTDTPILNWYLYTYATAAACLFAAARLLAPPRERSPGFHAPPLLESLGTVLLFLLLNIEIADYFTEPGTYRLAFEFSGNLSRDLAYTIAWSIFALGLLVVGIWRHSRGARYAALGLLGVTLLKLFFHDLDHLAQLYRVGALLVVAIIAILASFLYQRFLPPAEKPSPPPGQ